MADGSISSLSAITLEYMVSACPPSVPPPERPGTIPIDEEEVQICSQDLMECPGGVYVGRGINCEFEDCPDVEYLTSAHNFEHNFDYYVKDGILHFLGTLSKREGTYE